MIVDASVAVKWLIKEANSEQALSVLEEQSYLAAPSLIRLEVASVIIRLLRMGEIRLEEAQQHCKDWHEALQEQRILELHAVESDYDKAIELALRHKHQVADCLYIAQAMRLDVPLITADKKQAQTARDMGIDIHTL